MLRLTDHREAALAAARFLASTRIDAPDGAVWPVEPGGPVRLDLYGGVAGVVLFHLELHRARGEARWLSEALAGARALAARTGPPAAPGLWDGLAGIACVLHDANRASGDGVLARAAARALEGARSAADRVDADLDVVSGIAGVGTVLLRAARWPDLGFDPLAAASALGRRLVAAAVPSRGGVEWPCGPSHPIVYSNFAHGTAGIAHFLCRLYGATREEAFLEAALAGARWLERAADLRDGGFRVFHHEGGGEELFYLGWCHGPAGTARLFLALAEVTGESRWLDLARRGARTLLDAGVPPRPAPGVWDNVGRCCGTAGIGDFFLRMDRAAPDAAYRGAARAIADDLLRRATPLAAPGGTALKWVHAEHRDRAGLLSAQTGFMQGAAGIGSFLLHLT